MNGWHMAAVLMMLVRAGLATAVESPPAASPEAGVEWLKPEQLPIKGMVRYRDSEGNAVYTSEDGRFVFRGEMVDQWTGQEIGQHEAFNRLNMDRAGIKIEEMSLLLGSGDKLLTLFVAPECEPCQRLLTLAVADENLRRYRFRLVLLHATEQGKQVNARIWCAKDRLVALRHEYLGDSKKPDAAASTCDISGLALAFAAAKAFGFSELPMVMDDTNLVHTGEIQSFAELGASK